MIMIHLNTFCTKHAIFQMVVRFGMCFTREQSVISSIIKFKNDTLLARNLNSLLWIVFCNFIRFFFKGRQAASAGQ